MAKSARSTGSSGATPATTLLVRAGVAHTLHPYEHDPSVTSYGDDAAAALGIDPSRVFKTLLVDVDGALVVAVLPVDRMLDLKALAAAAGGKRATMADPHHAEKVTGYVVGGISPLGQRKRLTTVVDASATDRPALLVSGGRRGLDVELAVADLVALLAARIAAICRAG